MTDLHPAVSPFTKQIIDDRLVRDIVARGAQSTADERKAGGLMMGDMVQQYRVAMKMPGIPPGAMIDMANNVLTTAREANKPMNKVFDIVYPPLEAAAPNESETLYIKGFFYVKYAWEARGNGLANTVTPEGWKGFAERLAVANDALTKAWELDPTNPDPPTEMLTVVMGQDGDRDMMEKWFNRAMDANPDHYSACHQKLNYLEPKWHGDAAAMLEFGHQCFDQGNWRSEIPLILAEAG